jgi:hypothetical protein
MESLGGANAVPKYTPPPPKTPVAQGGYLNQLAGAGSSASNSAPAPAPVPATPYVSSFAAASTPAASGNYLDNLGGGSVKKYTPPPPKEPVVEWIP